MKLHKKLLLTLMNSKLYKYLLLHIIPFIRFTTYYTSLRGWKYRRGYKLLKPGDIILTKDKKKLTALLIPGEFSHAALCVDVGSEWEISEMTHTNYTKSCFFDICKESDRVVIIRCNDWDEDYITNVILTCKSFVTAVYDTDFKLEDKMTLGIPSLYCSELVYQSDYAHKLIVSLEDLAGIGRPYISPFGLSKAKNITWVWDSDTEKLDAPLTKSLG
jgi:hypothetical protein